MYKLYHNPRCSKSRIALEILEKSGKEFEVIRYLDGPLPKSEITQIVNNLHGDFRAVIRKGEDEFKQSGLKLSELSKAEVIDFLCQNTRCMERPILSDGKEFVIGRPSEQLAILLD